MPAIFLGQQPDPVKLLLTHLQCFPRYPSNLRSSPIRDVSTPYSPLHYHSRSSRRSHQYRLRRSILPVHAVSGRQPRMGRWSRDGGASWLRDRVRHCLGFTRVRTWRDGAWRLFRSGSLIPLALDRGVHSMTYGFSPKIYELNM